MNRIKEAYETSRMTIKEIAHYLNVPQRTLQDWIYGKRNCKKPDEIAEKIMALANLTEEGRESLISDDGDWETALALYKVEQARRSSKIGAYRETFHRALKRVPESCMSLPPEAIAEMVDAINEAYQDGKNGQSE